MRYRLLQIIALYVMSVSAFAQDSVTTFIAQCTEAGKSNAFCHCALTSMSDHKRSMDERQLPQLLLNYESELAFYLADPAITQDKVDAACDLHDAAMAIEVKISQSTGPWGTEETRALLKDKLALLDEKEKLVMSYQASHQVNGGLIGGNFCADRYKIAQIQQYLAEQDPAVYGSVRAMMIPGRPISLRPFFVTALRAGCQQ